MMRDSEIVHVSTVQDLNKEGKIFLAMLTSNLLRKKKGVMFHLFCRLGMN
jgi:hypothetical protein